MQTLTKTQKVTIIGAGWLGLPLATTLSKDNFSVIATKKDPQIAQDLQNKLGGDSLEFLRFNVSNILEIIEKKPKRFSGYTNLYQKLFSDRHIIITIPPSSFIDVHSPQASSAYTKAIEYIFAKAKEFGAKSILFTSSISVYGKSSGLINEDLPTMPKSANAKAIVAAENVLTNQTDISTIILRLGGLIGNGRHPIYTLSGRENIQEPNNAINLVHIENVINAITALLKRPINVKHQVYNIVAPVNPNRKPYYDAIAQFLSLPAPRFTISQPLLKRVIDGNRITEEGDFHYRVLDLITASL